MAYAFNDDKSKLEIKFINIDFPSLRVNQTSEKTLTISQLLNLGISDITEWAIVGVSYKRTGSGTKYGYDRVLVDGSIYPHVRYDTTNGLSVTIYGKVTGTNDYTCTVMLVKNV